MNANALKTSTTIFLIAKVTASLLLFTAVLAVIAIAMPWDLIESEYCRYQKVKHPGEYDQCFVCNYWFQHKRMSWYVGGGITAWICDECWGRGMYE